MSDLIDRQTAIDALKDWYDGAIVGTFSGVKKVINTLPSAQPERKKGRWMHQASDSMVPYQCADCKAGSFIPWNYCPNCGAEMTEGDENEQS